MASLPVVITGAQITISWNNQQYKEVADINFTINYEQDEIYGIDSLYVQELADGRISVEGTVSGFRLKNNGGLQGKNMRPLFTDVGASPYISLLVQDKTTNEQILFVAQCKIVSESHSIPSRGVYKLNFNFKGIIPLFALDRS